MRIGFVATRLSGTDGVSLEVEKWVHVLRGMGHEAFYCAGELGGYAAGGTLIPLMHFAHPAIMALSDRAFVDREPLETLQPDLQAMVDEIREPLRAFILDNRLDVIVPQNALTIPMNLALGMALTALIAALGIPAIAHHHDFFWERQRFQTNKVLPLLDYAFPPDLPTIRHVTINSIARQRLRLRRDIHSIVIPNVHDFDAPAPSVDEYSRDVRQRLGLSDEARFVLQPTRVIQRKGIEMAIELVRLLDLSDTPLFITHSAGDEGLDYWHWLQREAAMMRVDLRLIDHLVEPERRMASSGKIYSLWDVYPHADLITYPSMYEGFGNALLEAIYFKRLVVVNRYPVYNADIGPLGFEFVELDGFVSDDAVARVAALLDDPEQAHEMAEKNYAVAREHFSLQVLDRKLRGVLDSF